MFKVELVDAIPEGQDLKVYFQGDWFDLCRGPHMTSTGHVGDAFKLTKVAGAYWRGDQSRQQLQRIYGTAWASRRELDAYLTMIEEAEKRDHRRIGREMELFHLQEEAPGQVFWHPKGWAIWRALEGYLRRRLDHEGYREVKTPMLLDRKLWEASGHWEKFRESMFLAEVEEESGADKQIAALKPMNCPGHVQIFNQGIKSYRDLPLRLAEFGACHRYEPSGAMHGIMRVRGFTQDDAHIFCREDQITPETERFCALLSSVYRDLGFGTFRIKFSDRPAKRAGSDEVWDQAERALMEATKAAGYEVELNPGEGAFYGPKLEFVLTDAIGRDWQCGTLQVDFVLPERLGATYIGEDGGRHRPVMLHRAILGSFERFIGILIEDTAGKLPLWLAPTQVVVATITSDADAYAEAAVKKLEAAGLRASADTRNEKINYKVREHSVGKVPVLFVVGRREAEEGTVSIRRLGAKDQTSTGLDQAIRDLVAEAAPPDLRP
jgi:threonyl-tRNA synthetase